LELIDIVKRFAEGIVAVDQAIDNHKFNAQRDLTYSPGVKTLGERDLVQEVANWWVSSHPEDFNSASTFQLATEVKYPEIPRAKCDLILSTDGSPMDEPEWAIEVKHISFAGNNGKNNDFNVQKMLSPYLKDRSLIHDIQRLKAHPMGTKQAVLGYCFEYTTDSMREAHSRFTSASDLEILKNLKKVLHTNQGPLIIDPVANFADQVFEGLNLTDPIVMAPFSGAWKHPAGGNGTVFAWQIR
jgi:hypothetical protein